MRTINLSRILEYFLKSLPNLRVTLTYVFFSLILGFALGGLIAKGRMSRNKAISALAQGYVTLVRSTPSIILLFLVFYGLSAVTTGTFNIFLNSLPTVVFVIITFTINIGASSSEIIRSAYNSVSKGQLEAALSVGMTQLQAFNHVLLPQMFRNSIPNIGNTIIFLIKEGALAYVIGLRDVLGQAYFLSALDMNAYALDMCVALTLIYWPITAGLEKLFSVLEKKLEYKHVVVLEQKT